MSFPSALPLFRHLPRLIALALIAAGCASSSSSSAPRPSRNRNIISQEEIDQSHASTGFELVQSLRPEFLRSRGVTSTADSPSSGGLPSVYVNGSFYGPLASLSSISAATIHEVRFTNGRDATTKYGTGVANGVIEIQLK